MKQSDDQSCVAAVLAMIVGETEQYVKDWFGYRTPYGYLDEALFLAHHGTFLGITVPFEPDLSYPQLDPEQGMWAWVGTKGWPAVVVVDSERFPGKRHTIYWDGAMVWDPNPDTPDRRPLESYTIRRWTPLMFTDEREAWLKRRREGGA